MSVHKVGALLVPYVRKDFEMYNWVVIGERQPRGFIRSFLFSVFL